MAYARDWPRRNGPAGPPLVWKFEGLGKDIRRLNLAHGFSMGDRAAAV